ncbi:conserved hypothetical protein [Shewanella sediminis HAW-EB3]|uniref:UPF0319 protein Ssed_1784 n=1 Tax=Shewanella sediminis (strain HAW-EB3) TaxID=425104 RepID=A8FU72_SHESH|nr:DUF2057 domain-containing protein [Shewanella sediminis]ABV36395.1 conserved hypothetical protein [Shewanella sediminis HAW-EB3]
MKHLTLLASLSTITTLLFASQAWAEPTISFPNSAELLVVNGKAAESDSPMTLREGKNQIVLKYNTSFRQQGQQKRFSSEAIIVSFEASNQTYKLILPKLKSSSDADKFNSTPAIKLSDNKGQAVNYDTDILTKEGLQLGRDYSNEISVYNQSGANAAVSHFAVIKQNTKVQSAADVTTSVSTTSETMVNKQATTQNNQIPDQINVGQMLDFWYSQADEETRKAFKARIKNK